MTRRRGLTLFALCASASFALSPLHPAADLVSLPTSLPLPGGSTSTIGGGMAASMCAAPAQPATATGPGVPATPYIAAVATESVPGAPAPQDVQAGPPGTWVHISGAGLLVPGCVTTVWIGGVMQVYPAAPVTAATTPPQTTAPPAPTATDIVFQATSMPGGGPVSGPVTVRLSAPDSTPAVPDQVISNANWTFVMPPVVGAISSTHGTEMSPLTMSGQGFSLGGLVQAASATYRQGLAAPCDAEPATVSGDGSLTTVAPQTYCSGTAGVQLYAYRNLADPAAGMSRVTADAPQPFAVTATVTSVWPARAGPGDTVSVFGSGFGNGGSVRVGSATATPLWWSDREIDLTVPRGAGSGRLTVTRTDGSSFSAGSFALAPVALEPQGWWSWRQWGLAGLARLRGQPADQHTSPLPFDPGISGGTVRHELDPRLDVGVAGPVLRFLTGPLNLYVFALLALLILVLAVGMGALNASRRLAVRAARRGSQPHTGVVPFPRPQVAARVDRNVAVLRLRSRRHLGPEDAAARDMPLGHVLLGRGVIDRHQLRAALHQQRLHHRRLGEVLVARGAASEEAVWNALATQWGVPLTRPDLHWIDEGLASRIPAPDAIFGRVLPVRRTAHDALVAMADPGDMALRRDLERRLGCNVVPLLATPSDIRRVQERVFKPALLYESVAALRQRRPEASAHVLTTRRQRIAGLLLAAAFVLGAVTLRGAFAIGAVATVIALYAVVVAFRTAVIIRGARSQDVLEVSEEEMASLTNLPIYTILCPLYREAGVLPQLTEAIAKLRYPKELLDVKLLLEEDDTETLDVVREYPLPAYFDVVVVPAEGPRTKPKACNYGLQLARGEYCVIYDAEDVPEPDQLLKALCVFRRSPADVGCVQAKLNFYNPDQNPITGWFALEYAAWFEFFLPGLVSGALPVPLGGSSNHFPTALLRDLLAWDPDNVTEDADLGMRLHRAGHRTLIVDSTTYEEANSDFVNWMRQRSRWGKGYAVTWLVQMRHPLQLSREMGWRGFTAVQLILGGTFGISLLNLFAWSLTLLWTLGQFHVIAYLFPTWIYYTGMLEMLAGNFFFLYMGLWAAQQRRAWQLARLALAAPAYWLMMSLAMIKAATQLVTRPAFWEKTVHGLYETAAVPAAAESAEPEEPAAPVEEPAAQALSEAAAGGR